MSGILILEFHNVQCLDRIILAEPPERGKRNVQEKKDLGPSIPSNKIGAVLQVMKTYRMQVGNNDETGSNIKKNPIQQVSL